VDPAYSLELGLLSHAVQEAIFDRLQQRFGGAHAVGAADDQRIAVLDEIGGLVCRHDLVEHELRIHEAVSHPQAGVIDDLLGGFEMGLAWVRRRFDWIALCARQMRDRRKQGNCQIQERARNDIIASR
jgi:hypothetical protein